MEDELGVMMQRALHQKVVIIERHQQGIRRNLADEGVACGARRQALLLDVDVVLHLELEG
ncbi:hypothetical protein D7W81_05730 [Corallococcus aberystwythensis]|uniref:Uncharacterized protein n=2 Tax=Corallococcus aberystwythensis TaxID=2316722 RepID=A0A3A8QV02_9BACT|nr:hypothetical protein D7W81_05730 [Corallococcus aberystwythensis]